MVSGCVAFNARDLRPVYFKLLYFNDITSGSGSLSEHNPLIGAHELVFLPASVGCVVC